MAQVCRPPPSSNEAKTLAIFYGPAFDTAQLEHLGPGSVYAEPPRGDHFAMTRDSKVVVQITGCEASGVTYVKPADDPTRRRAAREGISQPR